MVVAEAESVGEEDQAAVVAAAVLLPTEERLVVVVVAAVVDEASTAGGVVVVLQVVVALQEEVLRVEILSVRILKSTISSPHTAILFKKFTGFTVNRILSKLE